MFIAGNGPKDANLDSTGLTITCSLGVERFDGKTEFSLFSPFNYIRIYIRKLTII